jgi:predicted nuclease of predicted toxin-antitoxin system
MTRWLCDENVPRLLVDELRARHHDVAWIVEDRRGLSDVEVLSLAAGEQRICLTFDKDFGELVGSAPLPAECGVLLLRLPFTPTSTTASRIATILESRDDWAGHFSVVEPGRVRMRRLHERSRL